MIFVGFTLCWATVCALAATRANTEEVGRALLQLSTHASPAVSLVAADSSDTNNNIIEEAVDAAMQGELRSSNNVEYNSGVVQSIAEAARRKLAAKAPFINASSLERQKYDSPYDTFGYVAKGSATPVVSLAPAPSPAELKLVKEKFLKAQEQTEHLEKELNEPVVIPPKCADCAKYFEVTHGEAAVKKAEEMEKTAKTRLQEAAAWEAAEEKRRRNLPAIALAMQREANLAYRQRVDAEKKALQAKIERITIQKVEKVKLERLKEAVSRQRLVDRLRAAEDVRVANCAKKAATEARKKLKLKAKAKLVESSEKVEKAKASDSKMVQAEVTAIGIDAKKADEAMVDDAARAIDDVMADTIADLRKEPPAAPSGKRLNLRVVAA